MCVRFLGSSKAVLVVVNGRELELWVWVKAHFQIQRDNDRPRIVQSCQFREVTLSFAQGLAQYPVAVTSLSPCCRGLLRGCCLTPMPKVHPTNSFSSWRPRGGSLPRWWLAYCILKMSTQSLSMNWNQDLNTVDLMSLGILKTSSKSAYYQDHYNGFLEWEFVWSSLLPAAKSSCC